MTRSRRRSLGLCSLTIVYLAATSGAGSPQGSLLEDGVLVTWYGNPHTAAMGVLGQAEGNERATALRVQAARYETVTTRQVHAAYHLVATVAQPHPGADGMWRRREFTHVIRGLLHEARVHGFQLILDVQPGRANVADEVRHLGPFLEDPLVHVGLDPEFTMMAAQVPGSHIGQLRAADVNRTLDVLEAIVRKHALPKKILILHQFTLGMLPDKEDIRESPLGRRAVHGRVRIAGAEAQYLPVGDAAGSAAVCRLQDLLQSGCESLPAGRRHGSGTDPGRRGLPVGRNVMAAPAGVRPPSPPAAARASGRASAGRTTARDRHAAASPLLTKYLSMPRDEPARPVTG
jgi:hypothetical protein